MLKAAVRRALEFLDRQLLPVVSKARGLASAYYLLLNPRFGREHRAIAAGRREYWRRLREAQRSCPRLRRNVHRLEKGLVMQPRQPVFATDYIGETVDAFLAAEAHGSLEPKELQWARDVLDRYFASVGDHADIGRARGRYTLQSRRPAEGFVSRTPRPQRDIPRARVGYEDFLALCRQRRSVRWFLDRPVPRELVLQAVTAAAEAPSACNRQPFLFRYLDDASAARGVAGISMGTTGYAQNIPALVVVLGDLSCYPEERDRHVVHVDAALAAMQFMLALETLGLSSCPINWPDVERLERRMDAALGLPRHIRPVMLIAVGYADPEGGVPYSAKKPAATLLRVDDDYRP
ncbi:MAG: nitroreductase family protein [Burkholderiaceae bacterium]